MTINIYCDGGARGNPGPAVAAFVIKDEAGILRNKRGKFLGTATNNVAEYQAVIEALGWLQNETKDKKKERVNEKLEVNFFLDSNLVVNQLNGLFKVKNSDLRNLIFQVRELEQSFVSIAMKQFSTVTVVYSYIPREQNWEADKLVNKTLDAVQ